MNETPTDERTHRRRRLDGWTLAGLAALSLPFFVRASGADAIPIRFCVLKATTGLACPTCGATRALGRLGLLDFSGALALNPGVTLAWGVVAAFSLGRLLGIIETEPPSLLVNRARWVILPLLFLGILLNWAYVALLQN